MFSNAILTLSNMAINEASVEIPKKVETNICEDMIQMLDSMPVLNENETVFTVDMVPVRGNKRLGRYLIEMVDLERYMITNHISDIPQAIGNILEHNELQGQFHNVGIIIDDNSIRDYLNERANSDNTSGTEPLGHNYNSPHEFPDGEHYNSKGLLGYGLLGKETNYARVRQIANSKRFMDVLTGRYGLPLFRPGYKDVGLMQEAAKEEDVKLDKKDGEEILQEKDNDKKSKKSDEKECDCGRDDCEICNPKKNKKKDNDDVDKEAEKTEQPGDEDVTQESTMSHLFKMNKKIENSIMQESSLENMSAHDLQVQRIKDIMSGKYDN